MSSAGRPLLAPTGSTGEQSRDRASDSPSGPSRPAGPSRARRTLIESACQACRRRKSKCNGKRPICTKCESLGSECVYEAEEGESRWAALRRRSQQLEEERDRIGESMEWMRDCPEPEALIVLDRIRATRFDRSTAPDTFINIVQTFRNERHATSTHMQQAPYAQNDQRLPPITALLGGSIRGEGPRMVVTQRVSNDSDDTGISMADAPGPSTDRNRIRLGTLEPSLRQASYATPTMPHLSSEESSTGSSLGTLGSAVVKHEYGSSGALNHSMSGIGGQMSMPAQFDSEESLRRRGSYPPPRPGGY